MPLPDLTGFCLPVSQNGALCVTLPGGAQVCSIFPGNRIPDPTELTAAFMGNLNSALTPLIPIFNIIDVVVALVNCVKAVESALGPPPDPSKLVTCFPELAKKLALLLKAIPQLTIPALIGDILDVIITYLSGLKNQILVIIRKQLRIALAATRATAIGSVALHTMVDCATDDLNGYLTNLNANSAPLGRLINLLNLLLDLAGLPEIPAIGSIGQDAAAAVSPLTTVIASLQTLRAGFP